MFKCSHNGIDLKCYTSSLCTFLRFSLLKMWLINTWISSEKNANNTTSKSSCRAHFGGHFERQTTISIRMRWYEQTSINTDQIGFNTLIFFSTSSSSSSIIIIIIINARGIIKSEMNPQQDTSFPQRRFVGLSRPLSDNVRHPSSN